VLGYQGVHLSDDRNQRLGYIWRPDYDPITRFAWKFYSGGTYGGVTYGKTATLLKTLEALIGEDTLRQALHTYFMRYRFTHPTGEDFLKTIEEVAAANGKTADLRPYFNQAVYGTQVLDYEVKGRRQRAGRLVAMPAKTTKAIIVPLSAFTARVTSSCPSPSKSNSTMARQSRMKPGTASIAGPATPTSRKPSSSPPKSIPQHQIWLDTNFFNNSYVIAVHSAASTQRQHLVDRAATHGPLRFLDCVVRAFLLVARTSKSGEE
jgi:hypothetical protein